MWKCLSRCFHKGERKAASRRKNSGGSSNPGSIILCYCFLLVLWAKVPAQFDK